MVFRSTTFLYKFNLCYWIKSHITQLRYLPLTGIAGVRICLYSEGLSQYALENYDCDFTKNFLCGARVPASLCNQGGKSDFERYSFSISGLACEQTTSCAGKQQLPAM
jgi:hypothetical protein